MKAYPEYKASGIEWLGEIPSHWKVVNLKYLIDEPLMYGANESPEIETNLSNPRYIRITDIDENGYLKKDTFRTLQLDKAQPYFLKYGDILFARSGATVGKTYRFSEDYPAAFAGYLIKASCGPNIDSLFLLYYTNTQCYNNWKNSIFDKSTIQNIAADKYNNMPVVVPSLAEQKSIAAYLDDVTGKIDALISEKRKQVEDIRAYRTSLITETVTRGLNPDAPLRPSGIDWLGDIPEHWKIVRLGLLFNAKAGGDAKPELYSSKKDLLHPFPVYTNSQVENQVYAYTSEAPFKSGSITVTGRGDIGRAFLRKEDFDAIIRLIVLSPINEVDCNYYKYFIDTVIPFLSDSAAVGQLSASQITKYLLAVPPLAEQQAIADFLDAKTAKIDELISELTKQIDELTEYKQAVITEAVTGKFDVRDYKPSN